MGTGDETAWRVKCQVHTSRPLTAVHVQAGTACTPVSRVRWAGVEVGTVASLVGWN